MIALLGIPVITFFCYKMTTSMVFDDSNESKAQFGQSMIGAITAQNLIAGVMIVMDQMLGFDPIFAIASLLVCFLCTGVEVVAAKKFLMGEKPLCESVSSFYKRTGLKRPK
tara:strand:- start:10 stop:342 length:333 start_codon:yes stop_codon:yes gene_type:complete